jgi:hypothetical protein
MDPAVASSLSVDSDIEPGASPNARDNTGSADQDSDEGLDFYDQL